MLKKRVRKLHYIYFSVVRIKRPDDNNIGFSNNLVPDREGDSGNIHHNREGRNKRLSEQSDK